jgi:hypothetical protein
MAHPIAPPPRCRCNRARSSTPSKAPAMSTSVSPGNPRRVPCFAHAGRRVNGEAHKGFVYGLRSDPL